MDNGAPSPHSAARRLIRSDACRGRFPLHAPCRMKAVLAGGQGLDAFNSSNSPQQDDKPGRDAPAGRPRVWSKSFGKGFVIAAVLAALCWAVVGWLVF